MDVWMAMPLLKELCGGLALLGAGTTVEAANVGGYLIRARWVMKCRNPVKGGAAGPSVVIVAETQDVIIHISYMDIMHVIVRHLQLAMGVTQLVSIISLAVMDMISIMSHQGASCDSVALSGGRTRSVVLAPVMTVGMVIVILILLNLILSRALWVESGGAGIDAVPPLLRRPALPGAPAAPAAASQREGRHHGGVARGAIGSRVDASSPGRDAVGCCAGEESIEVWRRPPQWLYLPSQGLVGNGISISGKIGVGEARGACEAWSTGACEEAATAAHQTADHQRKRKARADADVEDRLDKFGAAHRGRIRGRGGAPGHEDGAHSVHPIAHRIDEDVRGGDRIRGHGRVLGTRGAAGGSNAAVAIDEHQGAGASKAQQKLEARNAHLSKSLEAHAERVAKRDAAGDRPVAATPAERLAAIRRRVAERRQDDGGGATAAMGYDRLSAITKAAETAGDAEPETGFGHQKAQPAGTKEVQKIHFGEKEGCEFTSTACADGTGTYMQFVGSGAVGEAAEGTARDRHEDGASAAEARRVAWHTTVSSSTPADRAA